jgi:hypothetical protein
MTLGRRMRARICFLTIGPPTTPLIGLERKRPPTDAAPTFQAKIATTVAPTKTRVHASGVANHNGLCFMAYPKPRWSTV